MIRFLTLLTLLAMYGHADHSNQAQQLQGRKDFRARVNPCALYYGILWVSCTTILSVAFSDTFVSFCTWHRLAAKEDKKTHYDYNKHSNQSQTQGEYSLICCLVCPIIYTANISFSWPISAQSFLSAHGIGPLNADRRYFGDSKKTSTHLKSNKNTCWYYSVRSIHELCKRTCSVASHGTLTHPACSIGRTHEQRNRTIAKRNEGATYAKVNQNALYYHQM
jgi:hypothetical protein